jgi:type I restriction enzyme, R subunit
VRASGREHLRELLNRASGGVMFTTIHKFMPPNNEADSDAGGA